MSMNACPTIQPIGDHVSNGSGLGDPEGLEQEAGQRQEEEQAEEQPVARRSYRERSQPGSPGLAVGPPEAEPERLDPDPALDGHDDQADHQGGAEDVQEQRVRLVEPAGERVESERPGDVVLEGEDRRSV